MITPEPTLFNRWTKLKDRDTVANKLSRGTGLNVPIGFGIKNLVLSQQRENKRKQARAKTGRELQFVREHTLPVKEYNMHFLPLWLTYTRDFMSGVKKLDTKYTVERHSFLYHSPIRDSFWRFISIIVDGSFKPLWQIGEWFKNSKFLFNRYIIHVIGVSERYGPIARWLDQADLWSFRFRACWLRPIASFFYRIYRKCVLIIIWPILVPLRLLVPAGIPMSGILREFLEPNWREPTILEELSIIDINERVKIHRKYAATTNAPLEAKAYVSIVSIVTGDFYNRINIYVEDTLEMQLLGIITDEKNLFFMLEDDEDLEDFNNDLLDYDEIFGDEYQGYPWLTYEERVLYLDLVFIPICIGFFLVLGLLLFYYHGDGLGWEWNSKKEYDIFATFINNAEPGVIQAKFRGKIYWQSSIESFFVNNFICSVSPNMYSVLWDFNTDNIWHMILADFPHASSTEFQHI